jgi:high-affinity iron transporter
VLKPALIFLKWSNTMRIKTAIIISTAILSLSSTAFAADLVNGKTLFQQSCSSCHGAEGAGDGPVAAALPAEQKPASFQKAAFKKVTDDASFKELLKKGGAGMGLSAIMPAQPALTDAQLDDVIAYVRSLKK